MSYRPLVFEQSLPYTHIYILIGARMSVSELASTNMSAGGIMNERTKDMQYQT